METTYIGLEVRNNAPDTWNEIILALLSEFPFDSFEEKEEALWAYIPAKDFDENALQALDDIREAAGIHTIIHEMEKQNWNETWEKQFHPVEIEDICYIYAPFHEKPRSDAYAHTMNIMPKMAFGTGHHATTWLMIKSMFLDYDFSDKDVLDMGCGTGVLALFARFRGAASVHGIDIDDWAIENTFENFAANHLKAPEYAKCGNREAIPSEAMYDCILANINRNVLLEDLPVYVEHLRSGGTVFLSGFYPHDIPVLENVWRPLGLQIQQQREKSGWACVILQHQL